MLEISGVAAPDQIESAFPSEDRLSKGPAAVIECYQKIPCNPCYTACKKNSIKKLEDINDLPVINHDRCNGCGLCITKCPGLAIMVVDATYSGDEVLIKIPYEFVPLPGKGQIVKGLDREGQYVCDVRIDNVRDAKAFDRTPVISLAVPKAYLKTVRNFRI